MAKMWKSWALDVQAFILETSWRNLKSNTDWQIYLLEFIVIQVSWEKENTYNSFSILVLILHKLPFSLYVRNETSQLLLTQKEMFNSSFTNRNSSYPTKATCWAENMTINLIHQEIKLNSFKTLIECSFFDSVIHKPWTK